MKNKMIFILILLLLSPPILAYSGIISSSMKQSLNANEIKETNVVPDPELKKILNKVLKQNLDSPITAEQLKGLTGAIFAAGKNVKNIEGLQYCQGITTLHLENNHITDISPLANLTNLRVLRLSKNPIVDYGPLKNLSNLISLYLENNAISDVSIFLGLNKLQELFINNNNIKDVSLLKNLPQLQTLYINNNEISDISPLKAKKPLYLEAKNQRIEKEGINLKETTYSLVNEVKDIKGRIVEATNLKPQGDYIRESHQVVWKNIDLKSCKELTYDFSVKENTYYHFSGKVIQPLVEFSKPSILNKIPIINAENKVIKVGDEFDPLAEVSAYDEEDGTITLTLANVIKNTVNTKEAGTYEVTYKVTDQKGASSIKTITVIVNPKLESINQIPVIKAENKVIKVGDEFNPLAEVSAHDEEDGTITLTLANVIKNTVNTKEAGTYEVTYKVTDQKGASSIKTITVIVKNSNKQNCVVGADGELGTADDVCGNGNGKEEPTKDEEGNIHVPPGGSVSFPDKELPTPDGAIIHPDGSVTLPDGSEYDPEGNLKPKPPTPPQPPKPDQGGNEEIKPPKPSNPNCVVGPDGKPGTADDVCGIGTPDKKPNKKPDGSIEVPPGGAIVFPDKIIQVPDGAIIHPDGSVTLPDGTKLDSQGNRIETNHFLAGSNTSDNSNFLWWLILTLSSSTFFIERFKNRKNHMK